jgi:HlyD family secretion protein
MSKLRSSLGMILGSLVFSGMFAFIVSNAIRGPRTVATEKDALRAQRELPPPAGEERVSLELGDSVAGNGIVEPKDREVKLFSSVPGKVVELLFKEGDTVQAGAPILRLDDTKEKAALTLAQAGLSVATAELRRTRHGLRKEDREAQVADTQAAKSRADLAVSELKRTEMLAEKGGATASELDRAQQEAKTALATYKGAKARKKAALAGGRYDDVLLGLAKIEEAKAKLEQAKAALAERTLFAPFSGQILQLRARKGEYLTPGVGEAPISFGDTSRLRVRVDIDERDVAKVKLGASGFVATTAYPGRKFPGRVVIVGHHMGRKNIRTDDPVERIDTKILEVVIELEKGVKLVPGLRVVGYISQK